MEREPDSCCSADATCCRVESIITIDERGQMVLPKEIRDKAHIRSGDKLAIVGWEEDGEICCISLVRADHGIPALHYPIPSRAGRPRSPSASGARRHRGRIRRTGRSVYYSWGRPGDQW